MTLVQTEVDADEADYGGAGLNRRWEENRNNVMVFLKDLFKDCST